MVKQQKGRKNHVTHHTAQSNKTQTKLKNKGRKLGGEHSTLRGVSSDPRGRERGGGKKGM